MSTTRKIKAEYIDGISSQINYILKSSFNDYITGFSRYADSGTRPVDGTGGSPANFTIAKTTTDPIQGEGSLLFTKSNSTSIQGQGFSYDFTIPRGQRGRVQEITFDYEIVSGTYSGGTLSTDSDLIAYIYRTTATGRLIEPTIIKLDGSVSGVSYSFRSQFQTDSDATGYRLIIHAATTSALDYAIKFDNFYVGPAKQVSGSISSNPELYTATLTNGTNATAITRYWREGKFAHISGYVTWAGAGAAGVFQVSLPSGLAIDGDAIEDNTAQVVGTAYIVDSGGSPVMNSVSTLWGSSTTLAFAVQGAGTRFVPSGLNTGDSLAFTAKVPISGWGANGTLGQDADTRTIGLSATNSNGPSATVTGSFSVMKFSSTAKDDLNGYNTTTGLYTVPVSGWYHVYASASINATYASGNSNIVSIYKNGAEFQRNTHIAQAAIVATVTTPVVTFTYLNAGDTVGPYVLSSATTPTLATGSGPGNMFTVARVSGPSQIQATEHVGLSVNTTSTAIGSALATIVFTNKVLDTHGSYNTSTGIWTCPATATYCIEGAIFVTGTFGSDVRVNCMIRINGVDTVAALFRTGFNPTGGAGSGIATTTRRILAGQQVELRGATQATTPAYSSDTTLTYLNIAKVGL